MKVTLTAKIRSGILWEAAVAAGGQAELARRFGVTLGSMNKWVNLKEAPSDATIEKRWAEWEIALYETLGRIVEIDSVFPRGIRKVLVESDAPRSMEYTSDVDPAKLLQVRDTKLLPEGEAIARDRKKAIELALSRLSPREREAMVLRFGLDGSDPHTLNEIGQKWGRGKEIARMTVSSGLVKLRKRHWRAALKPLLPDETDEKS